MIHRLLRQLLFLIALLAWLPGCRCDRTRAIAELVSASGRVERDWSNRLRDWHPAEPGARFQMGDGVRSGDDGTAELSLQGGARLIVSPNSLLRFLPHGPSGFIALDVELGEAVLETKEETVRLHSSFGRVTIDPESRVTMARSKTGVRFAVSLGRVTFTDDAGAATQITKGKGIEVALGGAVIESFDASAAPAAPSAEPEPDKDAPIVAVTSGENAEQRPPGADWQHLAAGKKTLTPGTGVRVGADTTVEVQRGRQQVTLKEGQFVVGTKGGALVQVLRGPVQLRGIGASVEVAGGTIVAKDDDTAAEVALGDERAEVSVFLGRVEIDGDHTETVRGGEAARLHASGKIEVLHRGPARAELVVNAGDTFTVHDPHPPTAIGFRVGGKCPHGAVVEYGSARIAGAPEQINVSLATGTTSYRLRCLTAAGPADPPAAEGRVTVLHDAGTRPLNRTAPTTHVSTDGRRYTVLYQSRLPQISVGWETAPTAPSYTLAVQGPVARTVKTSSPAYAFPSGSLPEGTYRLFFDAASDPPRRSRTTTLAIRFDNATPAAALDGLPDLKPGQPTQLTGTALPGWKVSVGGRELPLDKQQRFSTEITLSQDAPAVPVRFEHPTRGVHYYLRRATR